MSSFETANESSVQSKFGMSKEKLREFTTNIDYVAAIIDGYILKDIDMLPLQALSWQTEQVGYRSATSKAPLIAITSAFSFEV